MPLFFFIAGITFHITKNPSGFILNKVQRIGYPYVFYSLTFGVLSNIIGVARGPLWFFETIFFALCLYMFIKNYFGHIYCHFIVLVLTLAGVFLAKTGNVILPFHINRALVALLFIHLGFTLKSIFGSTQIRNHYFALIIGLIMYGSGIIFYRNVALPSSDFVSGSIYTTNFLLFFITAIGGCLVTVAACRIISKLKFINWLGKNSMTIMGTHWPLILLLNVFISKLSLFDSITGKLALAGIEYIVIISFCSMCSIFFKKYIPVVTGYKAS